MNFEVNGYNIFLILAVTFFASIILVPIVIRIARHIGAMDVPDYSKNSRRIHTKITPRLGGLAIFLSFLTGYLFFGSVYEPMNSIFIGGIIIVLIGIVDDIKTVQARWKLIVQIIAACIVAFHGGIYLPEISIFGLHLYFGWFGYILAVFFIVGAINAINFIDGIDGIAAGTSSIYFATISIIAFALNRIGGIDVVLCMILLGATLGCLVYNFYPAKIFLGDTGSMFLGYMIAVIALLGFKTATVTSLIIPIIVLLLPIMDTLFAILRRLLKGEKPMAADAEHIHHQILKLNKSKTKTVLIIYAINILCASISIFYVLGDNQLAILLYIILMILVVIAVFKTDILFKQKKSRR